MIGIFDSGVGGLTVVKEISRQLPDCRIIYFGDTARLPYGTKGADFVRRYSAKITKWLLENGANLIVIACHTSSAWASDFLKENFSGDLARLASRAKRASGRKGIPIFEMIAPAAVEAVTASKNKRIGIIGTPGTIKSRAWEKKLLEKDSSLKLFSVACPLFVPLVEEGWIGGEITKATINKYLNPLKAKKIDVLILACTHYPLLGKTIKVVMGRKVKIINPAESLAKGLKLFLKNNPQIASKIKKGKNHKFFFSDEPYNFKKISHLCFNKKMKITVKDPF